MQLYLYMYTHTLISGIHYMYVAISFILGYFLIVSFSIALLGFFSVVLSVSVSLPLHHCNISNKVKVVTSTCIATHLRVLYSVLLDKLYNR